MKIQVNEKIAFTYFDASVLLHFLGRSLYTIFMPIVLLKNNYTLNQVILFFILSSLVTITTSFVSQKIFSKKNVIYFSIFAILSEITLLLLLTVKSFSTPIFILILTFEAFYFSFYYLAFYAVIAHYTSRKKASNNLGVVNIAVQLSTIASPLLGAYLLGLNNNLFLLTATAFLTLSLLPLIRIVKTDINGLDLPKVKIKKISYNLAEYFILSFAEIIIFVFWGIHAYLINMPLISIGLIPAASSVSSIIFIILIKNKLNNIKFNTKVITISVIGVSFFSLYRYLFPSHIILTNIAFGLLFSCYSLAATTKLIKEFNNKQTYFSSMLLSVTNFSARALASLLVLIIGLKNTILLPIIILPIYILFIKRKKSL